MFLSVTTLLGLVFLAFVVFVLAIRSRRRRSNPAPPNFDFSLDELHRLRQAGQLSPEEFERAKAVVLARQARSQDESDDATSLTRRGFAVLPPGSKPPAP